MLVTIGAKGLRWLMAISSPSLQLQYLINQFTTTLLSVDTTNNNGIKQMPKHRQTNYGHYLDLIDYHSNNNYNLLKTVLILALGKYN